MKYWRNREIKVLAMAVLVVAGAGTAIGAWAFSGAVALLVVVVLAAVVVIFSLFTLWRYRELDRLSSALARIAKGDYSLDIRDNSEGELSILRNEIYKVTVMLREQAEGLRAEKKNLATALSDISHQLKTPLTSMQVMVDLLVKDDLPADKREEFAGRLRGQVDRLQWLVTALLKLSQLDAGTVVFKREPVKISALVQAACAPLLIPMELRQQHLTTHGDPDVCLNCDFNWTAEALVNVIKNSVEHTPPRGELRVTWQQNPLYTEIAIADSGPGVDKADLPYIFNRFYKGKSSAPDSLGIGLAMSRSIVEAQQGSIAVKSGPSGTAFIIKFFK